MTSTATPPMAKQPKADEPEQPCTYASVKIDDEVLPLARAAAAELVDLLGRYLVEGFPV